MINGYKEVKGVTSFTKGIEALDNLEALLKKKGKLSINDIVKENELDSDWVYPPNSERNLKPEEPYLSSI